MSEKTCGTCKWFDMIDVASNRHPYTKNKSGTCERDGFWRGCWSASPACPHHQPRED